MLKYRVINKRTGKEATAEEMQRLIIAGGHNPLYILLPNGALRLTTHDATGYHHFALDDYCDVIAK